MITVRFIPWDPNAHFIIADLWSLNYSAAPGMTWRVRKSWVVSSLNGSNLNGSNLKLKWCGCPFTRCPQWFTLPTLHTFTPLCHPLHNDKTDLCDQQDHAEMTMCGFWSLVTRELLPSCLLLDTGRRNPATITWGHSGNRWRQPHDEELRPPTKSHMSEPPWRRVL